MEPSTERDSQERRIGPTVSKDKWINHAKAKLARGYVLIVGTERRNANFHSKEKGYEMCAYNVARQLIKDAVVHKVGEHHLGEVYELVELPEPPLRAKMKQERAVSDLDELLDNLDEGGADESEAANIA